MTPSVNAIRLLDVVAPTADLPDHGLLRGQVGTVVEIPSPGVFEIEFSDDESHTYFQAFFVKNQAVVIPEKYFHPRHLVDAAASGVCLAMDRSVHEHVPACPCWQIS